MVFYEITLRNKIQWKTAYNRIKVFGVINFGHDAGNRCRNR
jgi:hypothetical protein